MEELRVKKGSASEFKNSRLAWFLAAVVASPISFFLGKYFLSKVSPVEWTDDPPEKFLGVALTIGALTFPVFLSVLGIVRSYIWKSVPKAWTQEWAMQCFSIAALLFVVHIFNYVLGWLFTFSIFL